MDTILYLYWNDKAVERIWWCDLSNARRPTIANSVATALFGNSEGSSDCPASGSTFPPVFFAPQENGIKFSDGETYALDQRKLLRQLIRNGDIDSAFNKLREWYPQLVQFRNKVPTLTMVKIDYRRKRLTQNVLPHTDSVTFNGEQIWRLLHLCNNGGNGIGGDIFHPNHTLTTSFEFLTMVLVDKECSVIFDREQKYARMLPFMAAIINLYCEIPRLAEGTIPVKLRSIDPFYGAKYDMDKNMSLIQILSSRHRLRKSAGQCYEYGGDIDYRDWDHLYVMGFKG
eukprot:Gb_37592 [translate_table: standard]